MLSLVPNVLSIGFQHNAISLQPMDKSGHNLIS